MNQGGQIESAYESNQASKFDLVVELFEYLYEYIIEKILRCFWRDANILKTIWFVTKKTLMTWFCSIWVPNNETNLFE